MQQALAALVAVACLWRLWVLWRGLPAIWRGQAPPPSGPLPRLLRIDARSHPTYLLWAGAALGVVGFGALGVWWWQPLEAVALGLAFATVPLAVLHACVVRYGRPRALVPPGLRDDSSWPVVLPMLGRRTDFPWDGLPAETDHVVEVYQVNSKPGEPQLERFMYAQCSELGCQFVEFADPEAADEETSLRTKVAVHTTKQSPVIQIYV